MRCVSPNQERVAAAMAYRVHAGRAQRRWTLDELAARSGLSRRLLVQIEHAEANPRLATLLKLAAAPVTVASGRDTMTPWSTPVGSSARRLSAMAA